MLRPPRTVVRAGSCRVGVAERLRARRVWCVVALVAVGCASGPSAGSVIVGPSVEGGAGGTLAGSAPGEVSPAEEVPAGGVPAGGGGMFAVQAEGEVPAQEMVVPDASGGGDGVLVLVSVAVDSLTVRWVQSFAPDAAGFRLRWRQRPVREGQEIVWQSADVGASVRTYAVGGLTAGTRYRLRLAALDGDGRESDMAVAGFETLAPPVRNLSGAAVAHDAVTLAWDGPADWSPVGYVVQWRRRGPNQFLGRLELPPGRRSQIVEGLTGGVEYVFRVTARTAAGWQSKPAALGFITPAAPDTDLVLEVSVPSLLHRRRGHPARRQPLRHRPGHPHRDRRPRRRVLRHGLPARRRGDGAAAMAHHRRQSPLHAHRGRNTTQRRRRHHRDHLRQSGPRPDGPPRPRHQRRRSRSEDPHHRSRRRHRRHHHQHSHHRDHRVRRHRRQLAPRRLPRTRPHLQPLRDSSSKSPKEPKSATEASSKQTTSTTRSASPSTVAASQPY